MFEDDEVPIMYQVSTQIPEICTSLCVLQEAASSTGTSLRCFHDQEWGDRRSREGIYSQHAKHELGSAFRLAQPQKTYRQAEQRFSLVGCHLAFQSSTGQFLDC